MKHLFIINPVAGGKKNRYMETIRQINDVMASYSEPYEIYITKAPMDACARIRAEAESAGQLRVYAFGGDGTLNECVNGAAGYIVSMFVNLLRGINQRLKISTHNMNLNGSFALVCACNGRFYGGGFNPVPEALPDDGILDFLVVREVTRLKFLQIVGKYAKGRFREYKDIITHIRGDYMKIEGENELAVNVDGELILTKAISFRIIPRSINFIFPSV